MTIEIYKDKDIFDSVAEALVNPVNTYGVMGAGLAHAFKQRFPMNYEAYRKVCIAEMMKTGEVLIYKDWSKYIINFPTKLHWSEPSKIEYITCGLENMRIKLIDLEIASVAIPKLGCGLGKLNYKKVKQYIINTAEKSPQILWQIYE